MELLVQAWISGREAGMRPEVTNPMNDTPQPRTRNKAMQATQRPTRILPSVVKKAYKITGLLPMTGSINIKSGHCCGLGAVCAALGIQGSFRVKTLRDNFGSSYIDAWWRGFDFGNDGFDMFDGQGIRDGNAAAIAVGLRKAVK